MHGRVETLQHKSSSAIIRRQFIEEPRFNEYDQCRASGDEKVWALEVILHANSAASPWRHIIFTLAIIV
jgi:hypothetical protein